MTSAGEGCRDLHDKEGADTSRGKRQQQQQPPAPSPLKRSVDERDELNEMQEGRNYSHHLQGNGSGGDDDTDQQGMLLSSQDVPQLGRGISGGMIDLGDLGEPPVKVPRVADIAGRESLSTPEGSPDGEEDDAVSFSSGVSAQDDDDSRCGNTVEPEIPPPRDEELEMWIDMCEETNRVPRKPLRSDAVKSAGPFNFRLLFYPFGTSDARNPLDFAPSAFVEIVPPSKRGLRSETGKYFPDQWYLRLVNFCISVINFKNPEMSVFREDRKSFHVGSTDSGWRRLVPCDCRSPAGVNKLMEGGWTNKHGRMLLRCAAQPLRLGVESQGNRPDDDGPVVPYFGLENLGATCYLNGLLQSLFLIPQFRRIVYCSTLAADSGKLVPQPSSPSRSTSNGLQIVLALQNVFFKLESAARAPDSPPSSEASSGINGRSSRVPSNGETSKAVSSEVLVRAFGWDTADLFTQQDAQELSRLLCDKLEEMLKPSKSDKLIRDLFVGRLENYIECLDVDYKSTKEEVFYDLQLNVLSLTGEPLGSVEDSLKEYLQPEVMDGDDKYDAEGFGKQRARKGLRLLSMPPVFTIQLKRFCFSVDTMDMQKVNEYFQFGDVLDMSPYLYEAPSNPADSEYVLHTVLVHNGNVYGGHYYAFVRPELGQPGGEDKWYRFDDENVTRVTKEAAVDDNFGGPTPAEFENPFVEADARPAAARSAGRRSSVAGGSRGCKTHSAYILTYIRRSALEWVMKPCSLAEVNPYLHRRLLASTNTPTSTSSNPGSLETPDEASPEGETADQPVDVSVVCLSNVSLAQLVSHQYTWSPASVVDQIMEALAKDPQKPQLPAGATHTIVSSGALVDTLPTVEGVRGRSSVSNGPSAPSSSVKIYQLGRVEVSPSSKDTPALKFVEVISGYFLSMCLPRSACRDHPLADRVSRPVMIMMLADEQTTPKVEVSDSLGRKAVAGIHFGRKSRLVILRFFEPVSRTLQFFTTATITPSPAGLVKAARYVMNKKFRRQSETAHTSENLDERTDWKLYLERDGEAIAVDALSDMSKSMFNDVLGKYQRSISDGEVIVVQWYQEGLITLPEYFESLKHSAPVTFVVHDPFTRLHGPGVDYTRTAAAADPQQQLNKETFRCTRQEMMVDIRKTLYQALVDLVEANRDISAPSPFIPGSSVELGGYLLYMYTYDPFFIPLDGGEVVDDCIHHDMATLAIVGDHGGTFSKLEPFAHPELHIVFLPKHQSVSPGAMPMMCRAFSGARELAATVVWYLPTDMVTDVIRLALDAFKKPEVSFGLQSGIRALVTAAPCQGTTDAPQSKILMMLDSEDPTAQTFENVRAIELPCAGRSDIFSGRVGGNYLRIEESVEKEKNEEVIEVCHATRNGHSLFGHIFFVQLPSGQISGTDLKRRISEKLEVSETEVSSWRLLHNDTASCTFIRMDDTQVDTSRWHPLESSTLILRHQPPAADAAASLAERPLHLG